jgi:hypothetical protein
MRDRWAVVRMELLLKKFDGRLAIALSTCDEDAMNLV